MYSYKSQLIPHTANLVFFNILMVDVCFAALYPGRGAPAAFLPHTHGSYETEKLPPAATQKVFPRRNGITVTTPSPPTPQTNQTQRKGNSNRLNVKKGNLNRLNIQKR